MLLHAADVMSAHRARTIAVMARDGAKTVAEADPEVSEGMDFARYYARAAIDEESTPLGVVVVVPPWNFPYAIPAGGVLAALAGGNAVILKPAPETVAVAAALCAQLWEAGVPPEVLQLVPTRDDEVGQHLITHVGVSAVVLTGSYDTARLFTSWKPTLRLLAETSGKNALVITASADIDLAVKDLVHSAFGHAGQKCSAASLAIVERAVWEDRQFRDQLVDAVSSLRVGPGTELASDVGPLIRAPESALARALGALDPGEAWLITPQQLDRRRPAVAARGQDRGASGIVEPPQRVVRSRARNHGAHATSTKPSRGRTRRPTRSPPDCTRSTSRSASAGSSTSTAAISTSIGEPRARSSPASPSGAGSARASGLRPRPGAPTTSRVCVTGPRCQTSTTPSRARAPGGKR